MAKKASSVQDLVQEIYSFNLIDEPWIYVLMNDGRTEKVSLYELFDQAENVISLSNENMYMDTAITFILFAIIYTAYNRNEETKEMYKFEYRKDVILDYLKSVHHLFDIYDEEHPFLQVKEDATWYIIDKSNTDGVKTQLRKSKDKKDKSLYFLDLYNCSEKKESQWALKVNIDNLEDDWIARNLITYRMWNVSSNTGGGTDHKIYASTYLKNVESISGYAIVFVSGETLVDLFKHNICTRCVDTPQTPYWENNTDALFNTIKENIKYEIKENKANKTKEYEPYFTPALSMMSDVALILTYSNIFIHLNKGARTFRVGAGTRLSLNGINTFDQNSSPIRYIKYNKDVPEEIRVSKYINTIPFSKCRTYTLIKNILNNDIFVGARCLTVIRPPTLGGKECDFKETYSSPIIFVGNGILKATSLKEEKEFNTLKNNLGITCEKLEDLERNYEGKGKNLYTLIENLTSHKPSMKRYNAMIENVVKYAENKVLETSHKCLELSMGDKLTEERASSLNSDLFSDVLYKFQQSYDDVVRHYYSTYFFNLTKPTKKDKNNQNNQEKKEKNITMNRKDVFSMTAKNVNACIRHYSKNLVALRNLRSNNYQEDFTLELGIEEFKTDNRDSRLGSRHYTNMVKGIKDALHLWAIHQHKVGEDNTAAKFYKEEEKITYKETFGYVMYLKSKCLGGTNKEDWKKREINKYQLASHDLDKLIHYMSLVLQDVLVSYPSISMDYGRLAYFFNKIREDEDNMPELLEDIHQGFTLAINNEG